MLRSVEKKEGGLLLIYEMQVMEKLDDILRVSPIKSSCLIIIALTS
ncbi:15031_t:CDS:2 [Funneliformis geosporum]|nr:15031_t:CDS:2 [Funneliformis geosporum]